MRTPARRSLGVWCLLAVAAVRAAASLAEVGAEGRAGAGATYGVGARYLLSKNLGLFGEWMKNDKLEIDSYLFGVDFRF